MYKNIFETILNIGQKSSNDCLKETFLIKIKYSLVERSSI